MDACNHMAQSSIPVGPPRPGLGGPPISPHPLEQRSFSSVHGPSETGRPLPPPPSDIGRGRWGERGDIPFRDLHRNDPRRDFIDRRNLPPPPSDARNGVFHHEDNPTHWNDAPPLFGRGSESRDDHRQMEYHESSRRGCSRERGGRATYGSSHHRSSRARSPKPDKSVKDRLGPTPSTEGRPGGHHLRGSQREAHPPPPDVEIIEHLSTHSRPPSVLSQPRGRHSPPPPVHHHHHHPPEHRQRFEEGFSPSFTVNDRLGPPPPSRHPPPAPSQQPVPLFTPLADRLGGSPDSTARSVQARLGPPRITEPLDNNQGLVPFNTAGPTPLLATRSEPRSPLPDLRRELESYNPLSRSLQSPPPHLQSSSSGAVPLFGRSHSPSQQMISPIKGSDIASPNRRGPLSPVRVPGRRPLSPTPASTPRSCPPSPSKRPPLATSSPSRHHSSPTKHLQSPRTRSPSPGQHPSFSSRPISPAKHTTGHAQSPTSKSSKPLTQRGEGEEEGAREEQPPRSRHCSKYFSPPLSPVSGSTRTKKHHTSTGNGDSGSRHSVSSPPLSPPPLPTSSSASRHSRRSSSGKIKSPPSNSGTCYDVWKMQALSAFVCNNVPLCDSISEYALPIHMTMWTCAYV